MSYPPAPEPKPVVEISTTREDKYGRVPFDVRIPAIMLAKKKVGNVQVAQWLAKNLQEWLDAEE